MAAASKRELDAGDAAFAAVDRVRHAALVMQGFRAQRVTTSVGSMRVLVGRGTGPIPAIVALHGLASAAVDLSRLLRRLRAIAKVVVAPDLPGHGDSPAVMPSATLIQQGLNEALDALVARPAIVFGSSLGGAVAIRYAAASPDRVSGLVLASPAGAPGVAGELEALVSRFRVHAVADCEALMALVTPSTGRLLRRVYAWGLGARLRSPSIRALVAALHEGDALHPRELALLHIPIRLLWGAHDRLLPASHLAFFRRCLPSHAIVEELGEIGHAPHLEAPSLVAERVLALWRDRVTGHIEAPKR